MSPPGWQVSSILLKNSGEIAPEEMKRLSQSRNNAQLQMFLVVKIKSDAVKSNIAQEPGMLGWDLEILQAAGIYGLKQAYFWEWLEMGLGQG